MASKHDTRDRVVGVWGPDAYRWSGEERQRAAGFAIDPSGRQRVLGFPADSLGAAEWRRALSYPVRRYKRRARRFSAPDK